MNRFLAKLAGVASVVAAATITTAFAAPEARAAEDYPSKDIQILVGFNAGGGVDSTTRIVAKYAEKYWGGNAVVVNKPGGGGSISWNAMMRAKPDGYTIAAAVIPNIVYQPAVRAEGASGYQVEDLVQIGTVSRIPSAIYVSSDSKWQTLDELLENAKAAPGKLSLGVIGPNTVTDGLRVLFEQASDTRFQRVVFKGGAPLRKQLIGGHVDVMASNAMYAVSAPDKMRALAVASPKPFPLAPDIPTFESLGYDIEDYVWRGIVAPKGTPPERVEHLREGLRKMVKDPDFLKEMEQAGIFVDYVDPEATAEFIENFRKERKDVIATFREAAG